MSIDSLRRRVSAYKKYGYMKPIKDSISDDDFKKWYSARHRNHVFIRIFLNILPILLSGPIFHFIYLVAAKFSNRPYDWTMNFDMFSVANNILSLSKKDIDYKTPKESENSDKKPSAQVENIEPAEKTKETEKTIETEKSQEDSYELVYNPQKIEWKKVVKDIRKHIAINYLDDKALYNTFIRPVYEEGREIGLRALFDRYSPQARAYQEKILSFHLMSGASSKTNAEFKARLPLHPHRVLDSIYKENVSSDLFVLLVIAYQKLADVSKSQDVPDARFDAILDNLFSGQLKIQTKICCKTYLGKKFTEAEEKALVDPIFEDLWKNKTLLGLIYPFLDHKKVLNKRLLDNFEQETKFMKLYDLFLIMLKIGERGSEILENGMTDNFIKLLSCEDIHIPVYVNIMADLFKGTINQCNFEEEKLKGFVKKQREILTQQIKMNSENKRITNLLGKSEKNKILYAVVNRLVLLTPVMSKLSSDYVEDTMMYLIKELSGIDKGGLSSFPYSVGCMAKLSVFLSEDKANDLSNKLLLFIASYTSTEQTKSAISALKYLIRFVQGYDKARSADIIIEMARTINTSKPINPFINTQPLINMLKSLQGLSVEVSSEKMQEMLSEVKSNYSARTQVVVQTVLTLLSMQSNLTAEEVGEITNKYLGYLTDIQYTPNADVELIINAYNIRSHFITADQKILENIIEKNIGYSLKKHNILFVCLSINILIQAFPVVSNEFISKKLKLLFDNIDIVFTPHLNATISDMLVNVAPILSKLYREKYEEFSASIIESASTPVAGCIMGVGASPFYQDVLLAYLDCENVHMEKIKACLRAQFLDFYSGARYNYTNKSLAFVMNLSVTYLKNTEVPDQSCLYDMFQWIEFFSDSPNEIYILTSQLGKLLSDCPQDTLQAAFGKLSDQSYFFISTILVPNMQEFQQNFIQGLMANPNDNFDHLGRKEFAKLISKFCIHYGIKGDAKEVISKLAEYYKDDRESLQHIWLACNKNQGLESIVLEKYGIEVEDSKENSLTNVN